MLSKSRYEQLLAAESELASLKSQMMNLTLKRLSELETENNLLKDKINQLEKLVAHIQEEVQLERATAREARATACEALSRAEEALSRVELVEKQLLKKALIDEAKEQTQLFSDLIRVYLTTTFFNNLKRDGLYQVVFGRTWGEFFNRWSTEKQQHVPGQGNI